MNQTINNLLTEQLAPWETARNNYAALSGVQVKELDVNGIPYKVQFNPARIVSSGAKVDAQSIKERKCFLCPANLPPAQKGIPFEGHYNILVNPFPIFPRHLTIPEVAHVNQRIAVRFKDMLALAQALTDYTIFYNGPKCGASAPDHAGAESFQVFMQMRLHFGSFTSLYNVDDIICLKIFFHRENSLYHGTQ